MKTPEKNSRRRFLKNSAAVVAGFSIVPRQVLGRGFFDIKVKNNFYCAISASLFSVKFIHFCLNLVQSN